MGSSLSCLCARPEEKISGSERCCRRLDCCCPETYDEVHGGYNKVDYIRGSHGKLLDADGTLEAAVLAEYSPARWTELMAAQLDWQRSHAPQDLYAQASAEAFASSRQALQAFARLSGRASIGCEAAAFSLIREPGSSPPILQHASSSEGEWTATEGLHASLSAPARECQPLSQLCHELPISQIMQGSPHLHGSQELSADVLVRSSDRLEASSGVQQQERDRCCGSDSSQHGSEQCYSRADRSQHDISPAASDTAVLDERSLSTPTEILQQPELGPLRHAKEAEKVYEAFASPFGKSPLQKSISYSNMHGQGSGYNPNAASSSGAEVRMAPMFSSPFMSDQNGLGSHTPFGGWQPPLEGKALDSSTAADCGESPMPSVSPFFCSEPPLRSGSDPAPISFTGIAPRRSGVRTSTNTRVCGPSAAVSGIVNLHKELHLEPLMQLVCTVLQCEVAMLALLDSTQILVMRNGRMQSREETEASPLPSAWWQLPISQCCETVVVSDVATDSRMPAGIREKLGLGFFCARPLCSTVSRRLGTLCIGTKEPREFGAGPIGILNNLSELMVHEIEAACERASQRQQSERLLAAMDLYQDAFMLVDTTVRKWRILHLNLMAANEIGVQREEAKDAIFWDMFEVRNPHTGELAEPWVPCEAAAIKGQKFVLHKVRLSHASGDRLLTMRFRPACQEMQGSAYSCGLPLQQPGRPFYFVEVSEVPTAKASPPLNVLQPRAMYTRTSQIASPRVQTPRGVCPPLDLQSGPSQISTLTGSPVSPRGMPDAIPFQGLELGYVLGRGAFGSVFQGTYNGKHVAVKIIVDNDQARVKDGLPVEAHITAGLNHRNVVRTIAHAWRPLVSHMSASMSVWDSAGSNAVGPFTSCNEGETWLLLELCDKGTLQEAIISGFFKQKVSGAATVIEDFTNKLQPKEPSSEPEGASSVPSSEAQEPTEPKLDTDIGPNACMDAVLSAATEVANGMQYLHARSIVHGDLTGSNVLLQECLDSPYGITAKVADFGLSREMQSTSRIATRTCGTITHMPPELLSDDVVSKAADVYAFGVLMWELYHGVRAWDGLNHAQVIHAVAIMNSGLEFSPGCPASYQKLSKRCMSVDPDLRPTFEEVVPHLQNLELEFKTQ